LMILKKDEPRVEKFVLNGRIELAFYVHTGSNLTTFGRLKLGGEGSMETNYCVENLLTEKKLV
jgi:hypothetical protein